MPAWILAFTTLLRSARRRNQSSSVCRVFQRGFEVKIAFIIARKKNNVVVVFGTLKVQSFMLTEVRDSDLLIVVTSSTFLKRKDMLKEKSS